MSAMFTGAVKVKASLHEDRDVTSQDSLSLDAVRIVNNYLNGGICYIPYGCKPLTRKPLMLRLRGSIRACGPVPVVSDVVNIVSNTNISIVYTAVAFTLLAL
jgi:hypothetical protein